MTELQKFRAQVAAFTVTLQQREHAAQLRIAKANTERDAAMTAEKKLRAHVALCELLALAGATAAGVAMIPIDAADRLLVGGEPASRSALTQIVAEAKETAPAFFY